MIGNGMDIPTQPGCSKGRPMTTSGSPGGPDPPRQGKLRLQDYAPAILRASW